MAAWPTKKMRLSEFPVKYVYYTSSLLRLRHHRRLYAKDQVRKILAKFLVPSSYSGNEANSNEDVFAWMATGAALGKAEKGLCVSALARSVWLFSFLLDLASYQLAQRLTSQLYIPILCARMAYGYRSIDQEMILVP